MIMKKSFFVTILLIIIFALTPAFAWAEDTAAETYSGKLGKNVFWSFEDGILTIYGEGKMSNKIASEERASQKTADYAVQSNGESQGYHVRTPFRDPVDGGPDISKQIRKVVIKKGVTTVADRLFVRLTNLQEVRMSDSVTSIGQRAFQSCRSLQKIRFPKACSLGIYSFAGCVSLQGDLHLPDCGNIPEAAFKGCSGIVNVYVSPYTHSFDYKAFAGCSALKTVQGAFNVTSILNKAFYKCTALKSVSFGKVSKICKNAFSGCKSLKAVYYTGTKKQFKRIKIYDGNIDLSNAKLYANRVPKVALKRAVSRDYNKILIEWENASHAIGYQVYYATKKSGPYKRLSTATIKTSNGIASGAVHRKVSFDTTYYYKVRAYKTVNGKRRYGAFSDVICGKARLQKVKKIQAEADGNKATILWDAVKGADGYILSYHGSDEEWTEVDVSGKTGYVLKNLRSGICNYKITAYRLKNSKRVRGPESKVFGIWIN